MNSPSMPLLIEDTLRDLCPAIMKKAAKSFHFASLFFSAEQKIAAQYLYSWCRYCDDQIDLALSEAEAYERYMNLLRRTEEALSKPTPIVPASEEDYIFLALQNLCLAYQIPKQYPLELLAGLYTDVTFKPLKDTDELLLYAFRVASVVGLMMSHVMGVSDETALQDAVSAGLAMQLTNISRDVVEDFDRGRFYFPLSWTLTGLAPRNRDELLAEAVRLTPRLLSLADRLYDSGRRGLRFLPFRSACAVSVAIEVYSQIGRRVLKRRSDAWNSRAYVPLLSKLGYGAIGLWRVVMTSIRERFTQRKVFTAPSRAFLFEDWHHPVSPNP